MGGIARDRHGGGGAAGEGRGGEGDARDALLPDQPDGRGAFGRAVRAHWGIETGLHWVLDIAFREDESRARAGASAANLVVLRHIAMNLLKQERTAKVGIKNTRLKAAWDERYLLKVLAG